MAQNIANIRRYDVSSSVVGYCSHVKLIMLLLMVLLKIVTYWFLSAHSSSYCKRYGKSGTVTVPLSNFFVLVNFELFIFEVRL